MEGSLTGLPGGAGWRTCRVCGTSLYGRRERVTKRTIVGERFNVELFRCPGGHAREIRRPVEAAAA